VQTNNAHPQKQGATQVAPFTLLTPPMEEVVVRTTLNIKNSNLQALARIGTCKKLTLTAMTNEALKDYSGKMNNVQQIDAMIRETNGFWFKRAIDQVLKMLPIDTAKIMLPYQIAYLYCNLKDTADRDCVFSALKLTDELQQINAYNGLLQKASQFDGEKLKGYNIYQLAVDVKAKLTPLQYEYLTLKIGSDSMEQLRERRPEIFPDDILPDESQKEETATEETEDIDNVESVPILDIDMR
jgi:hypothetical protein